jgi:two-component system chemotaxis sensor kinase CheA
MTKTEQVTLDELFAGLEDDKEAASQYLSIFIDEAQSTLDELIEALLGLEAGGGRKNVEQLFVAAHRMKGSAASIGLNRIAKLAHLMEDLLQTLVDKDCVPTAKITDAMLSCTDGLRQSVKALGSGQADNDRFAALAAELIAARTAFEGSCIPQQALSETVATAANEDVAPSVIPPCAIGELRERVATLVAEEDYDLVLLGRGVFEPGLPLVGLKAQLVYEKLQNLGTVRYFDPPAADLEMIETLDAIVFAVTTDKPADIVRRTLWVTGLQEMTIEPVERRLSRTKTRAAASTSPAEAGPKPAETLRVDIERLDQLMNLAGQLTIGKARMIQIGGKLKKAVLEKDFVHARDAVGDLFEAIPLLDRVGDGIQQGVMNMRMLPIGPLFSRFHRVLRDLMRTNGKEIHLEISGESTELDKRMIDELADPMIHMIRNAADHGIELPEVRVAAGKPRHGTITLSAFHRGSNIIIRVADDGHGLDTDRIRAKALERGLVSDADAERMTPQQIRQLVWLPGLSTAKKVTEVSGRGVGMDIVRSKIEELNGSIEIDGELGRGTTITIKLPLTLAILPGLMVEIDTDVFAVPLESVLEIVHVTQRDINMVQGQRMASVRDRVVPILMLGRVFNWGQGGRERNTGELDAVTLVILGEGGQRVGLAVSQVLGEEDVVIKSIASNFHNVAGIAGASILGDGRVSLILDPHVRIEMSSRPGLAATGT